ncbi:hypothetical protein TSUD_224640 [Trifolium subterraneum]|uniref:Pre-rRNA-processing protein TSR2 homolog n=1 Tax=Trifolium subterraneum TaxID=3900 RepID=A0A2Z6M857_TRISU|nr:hypothetical protein TSUD_224640 [Trifolium subterraneum]
MEVFQEGIGLVLSRWSALRTAVENEWGGRNSHIKAQQFAADIFSWFTQSKDPLYIDDLETLLDEGALAFNLQIEDGLERSSPQKFKLSLHPCLKEYFKFYGVGMGEYPARKALRILFVNGNEDDDDSDENIIDEDDSANMDVDIQKSVSNSNSMNRTVNEPQPKVADEADEGWTSVSRRKNKGRKN